MKSLSTNNDPYILQLVEETDDTITARREGIEKPGVECIQVRVRGNNDRNGVDTSIEFETGKKEFYQHVKITNTLIHFIK